MRRKPEPVKRTMYLNRLCPVCVGKGTTADHEVPQVAEICDACGGAGCMAPVPTPVWEYPAPGPVEQLWNRHKRSVAVLVLGVLCGILGALVADLLLEVW